MNIPNGGTGGTFGGAMSETKKMTIEEFGRSVKAKYPQYANMSDAELGKKVLEKYPVYQSRITTEQTTPTDEGVKGIAGGVVGAGKGIASTLTGASTLGENILKGIGRFVTPNSLEDELGFAKTDQSSAERLVPESTRTPKGTAEKIGFGAEQIAEAFIPAGAAAKTIKAGTKAVEVAKGLGSLSKFVGKNLVRSGVGAAEGLGTRAVQTGGDMKDAGLAGAIAAAIPVVGAAGVGAYRGTKAAVNAISPLAGRAFSGVTKATGRALGKLSEASTTARALEQGPVSVAKAVQSGIPQELIEGVKTLSPSIAKKSIEMLDIAEQSSKSYFSKKQPKEVVGHALMEPVSVILKARDFFGKAMGKLRSSIPFTKLDVSDSYATLRSYLEKKGVQIRPDGFSIKSSGSTPRSDAKFYSDVLKSLRPNSSGASIRTARFLDNIRQRYFKEFNLSKLSKEPFSDEVDSFVSEMRKMLSGKIDEVTPGYSSVSQQYAQVMESLKDFVKLIGFKGSLEDMTEKELRTAEVAMRTLGNAASTADDVITRIVDTAKSLGYKGSKEEIDQLIRMADTIEGLFGSKQTRSLAGQVGRGVSGTDSTVNTLLEGGRSGGVVGAVSGFIGKHFGATTQEQVDALRTLLKENLGAEANSPMFKLKDFTKR